MINPQKNIFVIMGVSGCGKSTIGRMLADTLSLPFFDGDDYHPEKNIQKMSEGEPLNDEDRYSWLKALNTLALAHRNKGGVIACSALKESYRDILEKGVAPKPVWVYLEGSYEYILRRLTQRREHFMPSTLLRSQFDILEPPKNAIRVSVELEPSQIIKDILKNIPK
ncbi:gluconokinase [Muriicola sp.]|uniref:gluconokinase n=1 Tax=Muriicola sp. TaxID=2020856 RepID=UPI003C760958